MPLKQATRQDKPLITNILNQAFSDNKSANFVVRPGKHIYKRRQQLMNYAFEMAFPEQGVFINHQKNAAAICRLPGPSVNLMKKTWLDLNLAISTIGLNRAQIILERESYIKKWHPNTPFMYIWFIGVARGEQGRGNGSYLLKDLLDYADQLQWPAYLETSTYSNLNFYERQGFEVYHEWNFEPADFPLWFLHKPVNNR